MATSGTAAATAGLRYERQWTVLSVLDVLDGQAQYVVPEPPNPPGLPVLHEARGRRIPGPDFLVHQEDGTQVWHAVKHGSGPWTIQRLAREGLLQECWAVLQADGQFVLDVRAGARSLSVLADAARGATSWASFQGTGELQADFERLRNEWQAPPQEVYQALKRITVNQVDTESLAGLVETRLAGMVTGSPKIAEMTLVRLVEDSAGRVLAEGEVLEYLAAHGINRRAGKPADAQRHGRRAVAGLRSDSPSKEDLLGVGGDVRTLAELIAATGTRPPLAIALIGDWGAGKSSIMLQVEREVEALAARSRGYPGKSAFAGSVRQVRFNAWHYSDDQLWAGLISRLFQVLAVPAAPAAGMSGPDWAKSRQLRKDLLGEVQAKQEECEQLDARLDATARRSRPSGLLKGAGSPWAIWRELLDYLWVARRDVRAACPALLGWVVVLGASVATWHFLRPWVTVVIGVLGTFTSPVIAMLSRPRSWHQRLMKLNADEHEKLVAWQHDRQEELRDLRERLALVDAAEKLSSFLEGRAAPAAYGGYQGLLGQVRADLEQLSSTLAEARAEWADDGSTGEAPLERIVLYIDDLDRCPPRRVVEVLEAVHLMLALDLFVVVVAVDARWLVRSLEHHHRDLFIKDTLEGPGPAAEENERRLATPIDYLDKIFQIPYVLRPPTRDVVGRYLQALLPAPDTSDETLANGPDTGNDSLPEDDSAGQGHDVTGDHGGEPGAPAGLPADAEAGAPTIRPAGAKPADSAGDETVPADLRPPGLELSRAEFDFMARLGGLIQTPRAAKRMVNIYRLVRIGIPEEDLQPFTGNEKGGPYQAVQVLLAILVGSPAIAAEVFHSLLDAQPADSVLSVLQQMRLKRTPELDRERTSQRQLSRIESEITDLEPAAELPLTAGDCQRWCRELARFSFQTRELASDNFLHAYSATPPRQA
jgi:hypothetical protein